MLRVLLIEPDPIIARAATSRIAMYLKPSQLDHAPSEEVARQLMHTHHYGIIIPAGDGGQSLIDAVLSVQGEEQERVTHRLETISRQLESIATSEADHSEKLHTLQRAMYGDPHNGAKGIVRRIDRIEWSVQIGALIAGAALVALVGLAVGRVFGEYFR